MPRANPWAVGNVVEIRLADGSLAYGVVIKPPLMGFSTRTFAARPDNFSWLSNAIDFRIWVMKYAIGIRGWPVVANMPLSQADLEVPLFYRYDIISKRFYHYVDCVNDIPATRESCVGLECAAVWDPSHIADRLVDAACGRPNKWAASLKADGRG